MATTATAVPGSDTPRAGAGAVQVAMKLEVVTIPVSDLDRAKAFYAGLGWRLDADFRDGDQRAIQFTPPGSPCSIHFAPSAGPGAPGPARNLFLVVADIRAARDELVARGAEVSEVFHFSRGPAPFGEPVGGRAPGEQSYGSYASFSDPDGNGWLLQEVTSRFPGRIDSGVTSFGSAGDLAAALRRAAAAHNEHEKRLGRVDTEGWPEWYAAYLAAEQSGAELPS
ncbi:MAG TPA: VOC family protein [Longimicrobiaceae bacterium]|jgi:catechol 2,3-dioxygenase-like lactoylglutathione lyase family enzyme